MRVPTEAEWGGYQGDLDQDYAHKRFAGRTNQEMVPHFRRNLIESTGELRWMPEIPFRYYMLGFRDFVMAGEFEDLGASDAASCFLGLVSEKPEQPNYILPIMPELFRRCGTWRKSKLSLAQRRAFTEASTTNWLRSKACAMARAKMLATAWRAWTTMQEPKINGQTIRDQLKSKRNQLFEEFLRNPSNTSLAIEIRLIDDRIAESVGEFCDKEGVRV